MSFHRGEPRSSIRRVEAALTAAAVRFTQRSDHIQASCPVHEDRRPSLSIDYIGADARVLLHCQTGCTGGDILDALDLTWPELYDDYEPPEAYAARRHTERHQQRPRPAAAKIAPKPSIASPKGRLPKRLCGEDVRPVGPWQVVDTYDYVDVDGTVIHQELRHERAIETTDAGGTITRAIEKRFTQRWPDDTGGWLDRCPAGFEPVLYRLPDVHAWVASGRVVWVAEGVKDAEAFRALGEAATTNPSGAANFKASQAETLRGAHVVVVLDHDAAGYRRGVRLHELLADRVASLRFALPRAEGLHADASDHFDAGYGLNFADTTIDELAGLEQVAGLEELARAAGNAQSETTVRAEAWQAATNQKDAQAETKAVHRWVAETVKCLARAHGAYPDSLASTQLRARASTALEACQHAVLAAYGLSDQQPDDEVRALLAAPNTDDDNDDQGVGDDLGVEDDAEILDHPTKPQVPDPSARIPMSRGTWAYEEGGDGRRHRGVYAWHDSRWILVADLPFVRAQIIERDGSGRRTGVQWLMAATDDDPGEVVTWEDLGTARWANILNLRLSRDQKAKEAAATAIELVASDAEERERTPRIVDGQISIPVPDTLPAGYLTTCERPASDAMDGWGQVLGLVAQSPRMALVLGAAAVGPFVAALRRQSHVVALYGDSDQGKTVTMATAGAIWGDTTSPGGGLVRPWNTSIIGVTRYLGQLGVLPPFLDEAGQAGWQTPREWGKLIYDICEGAQRMVAEMRGTGVRITMPWHGILVSAGNGRMTDGLGAGRYAGVAKRVVDIETPLTLDATHAEAITDLLPEVYGHMGHQILATYDADTVATMITEASQALGMPDGGNQRTVAKHLHAHLAGAAMLDQLAGLEGRLYFAALEAAADYLEAWADPPHDADRMLDAIGDAIGSEPAMWPELADYLDHKQPANPETAGHVSLPGHGINRSLSGITNTDEDGGRTVWVFAHFWRHLCEDIGIDSAVACRELHARGMLRRTDSSRRAHEWTTKVRATGAKMYQLHFDFGDDFDHLHPETSPTGTQKTLDSVDPDTHLSPKSSSGDPIIAPTEPTFGDVEAETDAVPGTRSGCSGSVPGSVPGSKPPVTCSVPGVPGKNEKSTHVRAHVGTHGETPATNHTAAAVERSVCIICGHPASVTVNGQPMHLGDCAQTWQATGHDAPATSATTTPELATPAVETPAPPEPAQSSGGARATETRRTPTRADAGRPRFTAPAACLAAEGLYLASSQHLEWPGLDHLGDLAQLAGPDQLRLGWGGGEDRLPDVGQIWLYASALEKLGLPTDMSLPEDTPLTRAQRAKATRTMFAKLDSHPLVAGALEDGWQLGQGGHLGVWTRIWHRDLLPGGAFLVGLPWHRIDGVPLFDGNPGPGQLARRLHLFARHVGVTYRLTSAATGLDLIDHHRPPRRDATDTKGANRGRVALIRDAGAELPEWRANTKDTRFSALSQDFSWWRPWDRLSADEQALAYVHAYDRNASYLTPWQNIELGVEGLTHHSGDQASWDGTEKPGYFLIDTFDWPYWGLPAPTGARVAKNRMWVNVHTLKQLHMMGIDPPIYESYTWQTTARYLAGPGKALSTARTALTDSDGDTDAAAVLANVKLLYAATVGKLAERDHRPDFHLWRPDWQDHIIAATKTMILRQLAHNQEATGAIPLVVDRDAVFYASNDPDPAAAWPGDTGKLDTKIGAWKPAYTAELATWGPTYLTRATGRWPYADATAAMRPAGELP